MSNSTYDDKDFRERHEAAHSEFIKQSRGLYDSLTLMYERVGVVYVLGDNAIEYQIPEDAKKLIINIQTMIEDLRFYVYAAYGIDLSKGHSIQV
jgi:hypothetical protein